MRLHIRHLTRYSYQQPVDYALQQLRLRPKSRPGHTVESWAITVTGGKMETSSIDQHANEVDLISFDPGSSQIEILCEGIVSTTDRAGVVGPHQGHVPLWAFERPTPLTRAGNGVRSLAARAEGETTLDRLHSLSAVLREAIAYLPGTTHSETTAEEAVSAGSGVCQDHSHVFIAAARFMGIPARYVSGYLFMPDRTEQEATHAWAEAHVDGIGWIGFDVPNAVCPDAGYVRVATGLDYKDAAPISGLRYGEGDEGLLVSLQVQQ